MSEPRFPDRDLRLERLGKRDGLRPAPLGEAAQFAAPVAGAGGASARELQAAYEALIDAVFTAPGVTEWLRELRRMLAAMFAGKDAPPREPLPPDAIRAADPGLFRA
jgi:hypothetical protein